MKAHYRLIKGNLWYFLQVSKDQQFIKKCFSGTGQKQNVLHQHLTPNPSSLKQIPSSGNTNSLFPNCCCSTFANSKWWCLSACQQRFIKPALCPKVTQVNLSVFWAGIPPPLPELSHPQQCTNPGWHTAEYNSLNNYNHNDNYQMKEQSSSETQRGLLCFILPWLICNRSGRLCCELTATKGCSGAWLKATASSCSSVIKTQRNHQKIEGLNLTSHLKPPWQCKYENKLYSSSSSVNEL